MKRKRHSTKKTASRSGGSYVKRMSVRAGRTPPGFARSSMGLFLPRMTAEDPEPVPPRKLAAGLEAAKGQIKKLMRGLDDLTEGFTVQEVELAVSFSADGKFLGVGVGGATTVTLKLKPDAS